MSHIDAPQFITNFLTIEVKMESINTGLSMLEVTILLTFGISFLFILLLRRKRKKIEAELSLTEATLDEHRAKLKNYEKRCSELNRKYSSIIDMEQYTQKLLEDSNRKYESSNLESKLIIEKAHEKAEKLLTEASLTADIITAESKELNSKANKKLSDVKEKILLLTNGAHEEAERVIEFAKMQAQEIAGDAYEAKQKADSYETAIKAMKNTIEGYKDDYIVPNHSALDDLADEFSFKDAGVKLKKKASL